MDKRRSHIVLATIAGAQLLMSAPAHGAVDISMLPASIALISAQSPCSSAVQPATGNPRAAIMTTDTSKASAILGGKVSQLERISRQQAGLAETTPDTAQSNAFSGVGLALGFGARACANLAMPQATSLDARSGLRQNPLNEGDFLASKRLLVRRTGFDAAWNRVRQASLSRYVSAVPTQSMSSQSGFDKVAAVNSWANARIRYVDDQILYGKADYWASAGTTLRRGAGDCEDIAIAKMQLLAAMGFERSDMYLTIARDLARNADHAILVVKIEGKYWMLDNSTDQILDARENYDYRPIMSFSDSGKWLHGY